MEEVFRGLRNCRWHFVLLSSFIISDVTNAFFIVTISFSSLDLTTC
jgi:hypothetical protein